MLFPRIEEMRVPRDGVWTSERVKLVESCEEQGIRLVWKKERGRSGFDAGAGRECTMFC